MPVRLPGGARTWSKYAAELLIVAVGVALGLWATEWAADQSSSREVRDASRALHDELGDNYAAINFRKDAEPCIRRRIDDLRGWIAQQKAGSRTPLPDEIGRPGSYAMLDSVWDVSKAGQVAAKMPLEERRRYAAVYDVLESFSGHQVAERELWFEIGDFAGSSDLDARELARLSGLVSRAAARNDALSSNYKTLVDDLRRLGVKSPPNLPADLGARKILCTSFESLRQR
jgi:hypothetical protein